LSFAHIALEVPMSNGSSNLEPEKPKPEKTGAFQPEPPGNSPVGPEKTTRIFGSGWTGEPGAHPWLELCTFYLNYVYLTPKLPRWIINNVWGLCHYDNTIWVNISGRYRYWSL